MSEIPTAPMRADLRSVPLEELDYQHPLWELVLDLINELAPTTRRDEWWGTDGPGLLIFRAFLIAKALPDRIPEDDPQMTELWEDMEEVPSNPPEIGLSQ